MKYNDSDMDDLFRRASERYPLRTDSADWDRLVNALENGPTTPSDGEERRKRRFVLLWLLLIPLAGVGYLTWQTKSAHSTHQADVAAAKPAQQGAAVSGDVKTPNVVAGNGGKATAGNAAAADGRGAEGNGRVAGAVGNRQGNAGSEGTAVTGGKAAVVGDGKVVTGAGATDGAGSGRDGAAKVVAPGVAGVGGQYNGGRNINGKSKHLTNSRAGSGLDVAADQTGGIGGLTGTSQGSTSGAGKNGSAAVTGQPGKSGTGKSDVQEDDALMPALLDLRTVPVAGGFSVAVDVSSPYKPVERPEPATKVSTKRRSHGYIGLLGAPDFSTVRFQSMKGVGTTFGVLLGYSFNDRLAIESGVYLDRKRYYTSGEYFNTSKVRLQTGYTLLNVDGTCNMWEIPVNVRYNFNTSPRMKWFGTAGLSTYFMTNEKYTYAYDYNWMPPTDYSHWNIKKPSQYWFSILNLSAGFEQRIGKIGNLRLEPYVRVPLSGIGTGRLSIMSAGMNIGFTHQLW